VRSERELARSRRSILARAPDPETNRRFDLQLLFVTASLPPQVAECANFPAHFARQADKT
jgi:hypothetical protein